MAAIHAAEPIDEAVFAALAAAGFRPKVDEFKSSMAMAGNFAAQELRCTLRHLLMERCKVGLIICTTDERPQLVDLAFALVENLTAIARVPTETIFLDEGMKFPQKKSPTGWTVETQCDSKSVGGIQLADCAAHIVSVILLSEMGIINKMVPSGELYPEPEVEMAWQLWTSLRYALSSSEPVGGYDADGWCEPMMEPFGLNVTERCSPEIKAAVEARLSSVWVGCIH